MKYENKGWTMLLLALLTAPALAANKCVEVSGRIFYQAAPCPASARGGDMALNANRTFSGQAQHSSTEAAATATTSNADSLINSEPDHNVSIEKDAEQ
ncbi:MAG: hypothetical protein IPL59_16435 [Candidatus Competibacteraceae bacterium]|uniref:DUF4124 domain-containing protein n=1 Tax=Candidatus Contendobacter odensis Run_B_J11 TaxID=1400861 RepID=A0A7U7J612_9GAMM|nr:hypothetical protein [Candidatus Contendobacter odensis]MBK8536571.1 hypothetical protein [Candidatus Competibacteraceae bacterium]CDH47501.1 exported hypothetical protein [Candidatus Contendobacter odensis Run_B_J11]